MDKICSACFHKTSEPESCPECDPVKVEAVVAYQYQVETKEEV